MMLLLDVGNTNIKAATTDGGRLTPIGSVEHRTVGLGPALSAGQRIPGTVDRVVVCCVAGPSIRRELEAAIRDHFDLEAEFIVARREACGVTNAYPEAHRLGADRWAGLIGAHARGYEAACVVDAGSALTVDGLASGRHLARLRGVHPAPLCLQHIIRADRNHQRRAEGSQYLDQFRLSFLEECGGRSRFSS